MSQWSLFPLVTADTAFLILQLFSSCSCQNDSQVFEYAHTFFCVCENIRHLFYADRGESNNELLLSLNKNLLRSLETQEGLSNPSIHLALRLSDRHNLAKESEHLNQLKNHLHNDIQK